MKLRVLGVDCALPSDEATNVGFYDDRSFTDFDMVVVDPSRIHSRWEQIQPRGDGSFKTCAELDNGFSSSLVEDFSRRREETRLLLEKTAGIVICFLRRLRRELKVSWKLDGTDERRINQYAWLPPLTCELSEKSGGGSFTLPHKFSGEEFQPVDRRAEQIGEINRRHPFAEYFETFANQFLCEAIVKDSLFFRQKATPIARDKVGHLVAFELAYGQGRIVFLPPVKAGIDVKRIFWVLLQCAKEALTWSPPTKLPEWLPQYQLPGETAAAKKLSEFNAELAALQNRIKGAADDCGRLERMKAILYEQGKRGLEPPVRDTFRLFGFPVLEPEKYNESFDLYARMQDLDVIGEIHGTEDQVDLKTLS